MKKKVFKAIALVIALGLIVGVCLFANSLVGNPISKLLATNTAKGYLEENHPDMDYQLDGVTFNFKFGCYNAYFSSQTSPDSSFTLMLGMDGRIVQNYYEDHVVNRENTARRLDEAYRAAVDRVLESPAFPYDCHIGFGDLQFITADYKDEPDVPEYALVTNDLELDGIYDIRELGAKAGKLTVYIYDDTVTAERLAKILLDIKTMMDDAGVAFYAIDCVLEYPKPEDGKWQEGRVEVMAFGYADIYAEGLTQRVESANAAAEAYYNKMDAEKAELLGK